MPPGLADVQFQLERDHIAARATVDLEKVAARADAGRWNPLSYLAGRVPLEVKGRYRHAQEGFGSLEVALESGMPVGSKTLAVEGGVNLSPASIRSVLSELETLGLLAAPHTSAGRMPTEIGLRLFVDGMMQVAEPTAQERAAIDRRVASRHLLCCLSGDARRIGGRVPTCRRRSLGLPGTGRLGRRSAPCALGADHSRRKVDERALRPRPR